MADHGSCRNSFNEHGIFYMAMDAEFFKEETDRFKYKHIAGSLSFLPYGACVDHFQHWVYGNPEATPKKKKSKVVRTGVNLSSNSRL